MVVYFIKHSELKNQPPSVETIPAPNVNKIIYGCCMSIVEQNGLLHVGCDQDDQQ